MGASPRTGSGGAGGGGGAASSGGGAGGGGAGSAPASGPAAGDDEKDAIISELVTGLEQAEKEILSLMTKVAGLMKDAEASDKPPA